MISEKRAKTLMNLSLVVAIIGGGLMVYRFPSADSSIGKILNFGGLGFAVAMYIYGRRFTPSEDDENEDLDEEKGDS